MELIFDAGGAKAAVKDTPALLIFGAGGFTASQNTATVAKPVVVVIINT